MIHKVVVLLTVFLSVFVLSACKDRSPVMICQDEEITIGIYGNLPDISEYCTFYDFRDNTIEYSEEMIINSTIDTTTPGTYQLTIEVLGVRNTRNEFTLNVTVLDTRVYRDATGYYDLTDAPVDVKTAFLAAAEQYLMETMNGGIPLYSGVSYQLKSDRVVNLSEVYIPFIGWREYFTPLAQDDSTVKMYDGSFGEEGTYTFRTVSTQDVVSLNPYEMNDSVLVPYQSLLIGTLYSYIPSDDHIGYEYAPALASDIPIPINPTGSDMGHVTSYTWHIPVVEGLEWSYYKDNAPAYVTDHSVDAYDFVNGYKTAIDLEWYRAMVNGSDTVSSLYKIMKLDDYIAGRIPWDQVGVKALNATTIELMFDTEMTAYEVQQWTSKIPLTPVHQEMLNQLGENYGMALNTIAYLGPYKMDDYIEDEVIVLIRNEQYPQKELYPHDMISYELLEKTDYINAYQDGRLDILPIDAANALSFQETDRLLRIPNTTVFRLNINGFGTTQEQQKYFENSNYVPEPILANKTFQQAMYYAIDRNHLTLFMDAGYPSLNYFNDTYIIDYTTGIPFRYTEAGLAINENRYPTSYGYDIETTMTLFQQAIQEEIDQGHYLPGTEEQPTIIEIELYYFADSTQQVSMFNYIEDQFEFYFRDNENHIQIDILPRPTDFPNIYFDYINKGEFDIAIGGISGSIWNMVGYLDVFRSDNQSNFTMNYGFDTSIPSIIVEYKDPRINRIVVEEWSFDAISRVLTNETFVYQGQEAVIDEMDILGSNTSNVTLSIPWLENAPYTDMTYTLYEYNINTGFYRPIEGREGIPVVDGNLVRSGIQLYIGNLEPYNYSLSPSGGEIYTGDYKIELRYRFAEFEGTYFTMISPWFTTEPVLTLSNRLVRNTSIEALIELADDVSSSVSTVHIYEQTTGTLVSDAIIEISSLMNLSITGLEPGTKYVMAITLDDGYTFYEDFTTSSFSNGID